MHPDCCRVEPRVFASLILASYPVSLASAETLAPLAPCDSQRQHKQHCHMFRCGDVTDSHYASRSIRPSHGFPRKVGRQIAPLFLLYLLTGRLYPKSCLHGRLGGLAVSQCLLMGRNIWLYILWFRIIQNALPYWGVYNGLLSWSD